MRARNLSLFLVLLTIFIDWMGIGLVYPMFSTMIFSSECHFLPIDCSEMTRGLYLGILLAAMPLAQFFSSPILGMLSDQRGRKKIVVYTLYGATFGYLICLLGTFLENIPLLIIGRTIVGIAAGNASAMAASVADLSTSKTKSKNFALMSMCCGLGFAVGPFLGGWLSAFGFGWPFFMAAGVTLINSQLVRRFFQETHPKSAFSHISLALGFKHLKEAFARKHTQVIFLQFFLFCLGWSFFYEFVPVSWIADFGSSAKEIGNFYAYSAAFYVLSAGILIRPIINRFRAESILFYALVITSVLCLMMVFFNSWALMWVYLPFTQFFLALIWPNVTTLISNSADADSQGEILGLMHSVDSAAFGISPLLAGPLLGISIAMPPIVGGISLAMAALVLLLFLRTKALRLTP